ncbi:MAG: hypothetical protein JO235_03610, partial [Chroococcidiopsidaceae cyanobacterium CP_BM_RX_35]|nr:hypothetical protein [Chroococcidiopsidaceae cyanobacterium CP_BM_RX_35]
MDTIKFRQVGNSLGATFPQEYLKHMNVQSGDEVFISKEPDGRVVLSPFDPELTATMKAFDRFERRYRNALK